MHILYVADGKELRCEGDLDRDHQRQEGNEELCKEFAQSTNITIFVYVLEGWSS